MLCFSSRGHSEHRSCSLGLNLVSELGPESHPYQFPYISSWLNLCQNLPPWLWVCACPGTGAVLVIKADQPELKFPPETKSQKAKRIYLILADNPDEVFPLPYMCDSLSLPGPLSPPGTSHSQSPVIHLDLTAVSPLPTVPPPIPPSPPSSILS